MCHFLPNSWEGGNAMAHPTGQCEIKVCDRLPDDPEPLKSVVNFRTLRYKEHDVFALEISKPKEYSFRGM